MIEAIKQFVKKWSFLFNFGSNASQNKKNYLYFFSSVISSGLAAVSEGCSFGFILLAFSAINHQPISFGMGFGNLLFGWTEGYSHHQLFILFIIFAIVAQGIRSTFTFLAKYTMTLFTVALQLDAEKKIYKQIFSFSFSHVNQYKLGDLTEYIRIPYNVFTHIFTGLNEFFLNGTIMLASVGVMFFLIPQLTLFVLFSSIAFLYLQKFIAKKLAQYSKNLKKTIVDNSQFAVQNLHAIRPIHIFHRHEEALSRIKKLLSQSARANKKLNKLSATMQSIAEIGSVSLVGLTFVVGSILLQVSDTLILPLLIPFMGITHRLGTRMQAFIGGISTVSFHMGDLYRLQHIFDKKSKEFMNEGKLSCKHFNKKIVFQNVSLCYPEQKNNAVHDVSFSIKKGQMLALVGPSGAGKSSIVDLLTKLYEPTGGSIYIDGMNLQKIKSKDWRNLLGVVSQDTIIYNDTIEGNIRFGDQSSSVDNVIHAAQLAKADRFIANLPNGYLTVVGERGYRLSGGERQRIAIARALLRNPEILILDEATSNLDSESENFIQNAIQDLQQDRTLIVVAHRLSTIMEADIILFLEDGQIKESGNHERLLSLEKKYANYWSLQAKNHLINL